MSKGLKLAALGVVVVLGGAQLVRPELTNPPIVPNRTIGAQLGPASRAAAILDRSCRDCHSNATEWRWYARVAPLSWLMVRGVAEGRRIVNFSEWAAYPPEQRRALLAASCQAVTSGKMPGIYTSVRPETRLTEQDIKAICDAAEAASTPTTDR